MSSVIIIYLMIGLAHWAAHLIQCSSCHRVAAEAFEGFLEGVVKTCGWPLDLAHYILEAVGKAPQEIHTEMIELRPIEGETKEEFYARGKAEVEARMKAMRERKKK